MIAVADINIRTATPRDADSEALRRLLSAATRSSLVPDLVATTVAHGLCLLASVDSDLIGAACLLPADETDVWILRAIAVRDDRQLSGVGRQLVQELVVRSGAKVIHAETDADAVGFYARLGFSVKSLGETFPGVERFACSLKACS